jgi:hypothetical protein
MQSKRDAVPARWMARSSWHGWNGRAQVNSHWRSEFVQNRTRSLDLRVILIERVNGFIERAPEHAARAHFFPESVPPVKRKHHPAMSGADRWGLFRSSRKFRQDRFSNRGVFAHSPSVLQRGDGTRATVIERRWRRTRHRSRSDRPDR